MDAETYGAYTVFEADWDYNNRMATTDGVWATPASYSYDHTGQRVIKDIDSGSEIIVYPNKYFDKKIVGEDETITENIYANNQLVLTITDDGTNRNEYYVHDDHLTSSNVMTKDDGDVEQVVDYFPFGNMRFNEQSDPGNSFDQRLKFTQKEFENDASGLQYFGARYYSGEAGKFVSEDPLFLDLGSDIKKKYNKELLEFLSNPQELNSYSYVSNNPLKYVDPTGEYLRNSSTGYNGLPGLWNRFSENLGIYRAYNVLTRYANVIDNYSSRDTIKSIIFEEQAHTLYDIFADKWGVGSTAGIGNITVNDSRQNLGYDSLTRKQLMDPTINISDINNRLESISSLLSSQYGISSDNKDYISYLGSAYHDQRALGTISDYGKRVQAYYNDIQKQGAPAPDQDVKLGSIDIKQLSNRIK